MLDRLDKLVDELGDLQHRVLLLAGLPRSGKSALLRALGVRRGITPLYVGGALGRRLLPLSQRERQLQTGALFREVVDKNASGDPVLLDNLELLFDASLALNPVDLLRQRGHSRRVVAVWPGAYADGRLSYAQMGHPEYQDYPAQGLVVLDIQQ